MPVTHERLDPRTTSWGRWCAADMVRRPSDSRRRRTAVLSTSLRRNMDAHIALFCDANEWQGTAIAARSLRACDHLAPRTYASRMPHAAPRLRSCGVPLTVPLPAGRTALQVWADRHHDLDVVTHFLRTIGPTRGAVSDRVTDAVCALLTRAVPLWGRHASASHRL